MYFHIALVLLLVTRAFGSENIALGKPTWQEHPWPDPRYYSGDNAVDGLYNDRSLPGGQCSVSAINQYTATWRVDLGNVFSISHINIYYRTDNQPKVQNENARRMAGFYLYVSNTTLKETGHLCFHENQTKQEMILEDITINCCVSGRYVIYYNERKQNVEYPVFYSKYAYNDLCEVEVYGCNVSIKNGEIFKNRCPKNCHEGHCDINTGHCLKCILGLQGPLCDQGCDSNHYGSSCSLECNRNCENSTCNDTTGLCTLGCKTGFFGDKCDRQCTCCPSGCDRLTGRCNGDCPVGKQSPVPNTENRSRLYVVITVLCISLLLNIFTITRIFRNKACKRHDVNQEEKKDTDTISTPGIYDTAEENAGYQELGQLSGPSNYDHLQGPSTNK
ncbi:uncharacterized protein [Magallana gigas]|uniref:uncharacterized protein isoform X1 n=1 Tax=Magallana gigas TaxID=29159 RepID=UPI0033406C9A